MSPAHVLEPTYRRLKRGLMDGVWPAGAKLEAVRLADEFGVSMTPVRDSLNHLAGEGFVDLTPGEGFRVALLTEQGLRDMLGVNALLLTAATGSDWRFPHKGQSEVQGDGYAERISAAFSALAAGSANRFLGELVDRISERLHPIRKREPDVLPSAMETLRTIENSLQATSDVRHAVLRHYHELCRARVSQLINPP